MQCRHPDIGFSSPELALGTAEHESLASEAEIISKRELRYRIESGKALSLRETLFEGTYQGVLIKGIPDYVEIKAGKALLLLDYKFSRHRRIFPAHRIQVDTYGYLLHKNHLDTDSLVCGIAIILPSEQAQIDVPDEVTSLMKMGRAEMRRRKLGKMLFSPPGVYGELYLFSLENARKNLSWATDYWRKRRGPIPTKKVYKCKVCSFNATGLCDVARTPANTRGRKRA